MAITSAQLAQQKANYASLAVRVLPHDSSTLLKDNNKHLNIKIMSKEQNTNHPDSEKELNNASKNVAQEASETAEIQKKKKNHTWLWILLILILAAIIVFLLMNRGQKEPETIVVRDTVVETQTQEVVVEVHDTLYIQQLAEIEENFNAAQFKQGKADLSRDAEFVLHDLAKLMKQYPEMKLRIEGHTSAEGEAHLNQKLSEARAQAAVTFLVEHEGINAERLEAAGFGSSKLKNTEDPMAPENRRTEFEIIH